MKHICHNLQETKEFANQFAKQLKLGDVLLLRGDLGAGKTELVRHIVASKLGSEIEVSSPTYNLVNIYENEKGAIWHYDLYRVEDVGELEELGLAEAIEKALVIIEWPEIAQGYLPKNTTAIEIKTISENTREFNVLQ